METRSLGDRHNPPLVFLHGFMGSGADWLPVAEHFKENFYCLLPDLPGHGATPLDAHPGYASWSVLLKETLAVRHIERMGLIGYSLGGRLALSFTLTYPNMVARLVLESASPGLSDPQERQLRAKRDEALAASILQEGLEAFISRWYDLPLFASLNRHPNLKAELSRQRVLQSAQDIATVLNALSPGRQPDLSARLPELVAPTLLISGRLDRKYTELTRHMAQAVPNSRLASLAGCGHNLHRECPAGYVAQLQDWLMATGYR